MNPVAFTIFGQEIRWYGVLIAAAMILGVAISYKRAPKFGIEQERVIDLCLFCFPAAVIGARLWYVLFNYELYRGDWSAIINVRQGGLAFHGGLIFAIITAVILCRKWKLNIWRVMDLAAPVIALGQAVGRWGNFFNHEAHGGPTNLPWAIEVNGQMVHPTFLYESIWCFILFIFLMIITDRRKFDGQLILIYGILYSVERFFVEALRTDSLYIGVFKTAQLVSIAAVLLCAVIYYIKNRKNRKNSSI